MIENNSEKGEPKGSFFFLPATIFNLGYHRFLDCSCRNQNAVLTYFVNESLQENAKHYIHFRV